MLSALFTYPSTTLGNTHGEQSNESEQSSPANLQLFQMITACLSTAIKLFFGIQKQGDQLI